MDQILKKSLEKVGIEITDEQKEQFDTYHKLLEEWNKVMNLTGITEYEEVVEIINDNIIENEQINELIKEKTYEGCDWVSIKILLEGIHYKNDYYYHIDGYGNIEDLTIKHLEDMYEDIKSELTDILEEQ